MAKQLWVIEILSQDRKVRRKRLQAIYQECYPWVELYVQKNNGSQEEAKDIFQDAVACLYQNLRMGKFKGDSSVKTYVHAIAKRLWLSQLRKKKTAREAMVSQVLPVMEAEPEVNADMVNHLLTHLNDNCRKLLVGFYYEAQSMSQIACDLGLGSAQAAKNKKVRCMRKLNSFIRENSIKREQLFV